MTVASIVATVMAAFVVASEIAQAIITTVNDRTVSAWKAWPPVVVTFMYAVWVFFACDALAKCGYHRLVFAETCRLGVQAIVLWLGFIFSKAPESRIKTFMHPLLATGVATQKKATT